jgi:hypothetical protein
MLEEALVALAAAGGTAVVQAAGTDAWIGFRTRMAKLLGRGDAQRERAELARLDQTAASLKAADPPDAERARLRHEASWQTRLEILLEDMAGEERRRAAADLMGLVHSLGGTIGSISAGAGGFAVGGNVEISATGHGSMAAAIVNGDVNFRNPGKPASPVPPWEASAPLGAAYDGRSARIRATGHGTAIGSYHAAPDAPDPGKTQKAAEMEHVRQRAAVAKVAHSRFISAMPKPIFTEIEWRQVPIKGRINRLLNERLTDGRMFEPAGAAYVDIYVRGMLDHIRTLTSTPDQLYELGRYLATLSRPGWKVDSAPKSYTLTAYPVREVDQYIAELGECLGAFFGEIAQE